MSSQKNRSIRYEYKDGRLSRTYGIGGLPLSLSVNGEEPIRALFDYDQFESDEINMILKILSSESIEKLYGYEEPTDMRKVKLQTPHKFTI